MDLFEAASTAVMPVGRMADLPIATVEAKPEFRQEAIVLGAGMQVAQIKDWKDYKFADELSIKAGIYGAPHIRDELPGGFIIYDDGKPVASLTYDYLEKDGKAHMYLGNLAVDPEIQRKGYGKVLLNEFFRTMDELGVGEFEFLAAKWPSYQYFQGYLERKLGFEMTPVTTLADMEFIVKRPAGRAWYSGGKADG